VEKEILKHYVRLGLDNKYIENFHLSKQIPGVGQFVTEFTYNSADLPVTMTYPDDEVVTFTYNNNMLPTSVSGTNTYAQSIAYDSANRMKEIIRGVNKIHTDYMYNTWNADGGRLLNLTSTRVSPAYNLQKICRIGNWM
jgi:YD repeat-containing protein